MRASRAVEARTAAHGWSVCRSGKRWPPSVPDSPRPMVPVRGRGMHARHTPKQGLKQGLKEKRMPTCTRLFLVQSTTPSRVPPAMMNLSFSQSGTFRELSPATLAGTRRQAGRGFPARTGQREPQRARGHDGRCRWRARLVHREERAPSFCPPLALAMHGQRVAPFPRPEFAGEWSSPGGAARRFSSLSPPPPQNSSAPPRLSRPHSHAHPSHTQCAARLCCPALPRPPPPGPRRRHGPRR